MRFQACVLLKYAELALKRRSRDCSSGLRVERHRGRGGLPVGSSGHALALLSGGFDSPVAPYHALRRGLRCDFLQYNGAPYTDPSSTHKACAPERRLARFQPDLHLYAVPVGRAERTLAISGAGESQIVAQRRMYLRPADAVAHRIGAQTLVTGDCLGQVASHTLPHMMTADQPAGLQVLRPLLAFDKLEIVDDARRLGTAEISVVPDEDCCRLFRPRRVGTRTTADPIARVEARAGLDAMVDETLTRLEQFDLDPCPSSGSHDSMA